jgi:predicted Rossmann fold flavoprotein
MTPALQSQDRDRPGRRCDVLVIGAGAAGLMCAIEAGRRGRKVLVIEHAAKPAEKIRISGGGRCNFTNIHASPKQFLSRNPDFCVSALKRFTAKDFIARVETRGIAWHEKELGQLFCDGSAREIIDMLLDDLRAAGGELELGVEPGAVTRTADGFSVETQVGGIACSALVSRAGADHRGSLSLRADQEPPVPRHGCTFRMPVRPQEPSAPVDSHSATHASAGNSRRQCARQSLLRRSGHPGAGARVI